MESTRPLNNYDVYGILAKTGRPMGSTCGVLLSDTLSQLDRPLGLGTGYYLILTD